MKVKVKKVTWEAELKSNHSRIVEEENGQRLLGSDKVLEKYPNHVHPVYEKYELPF